MSTRLRTASRFALSARTGGAFLIVLSSMLTAIFAHIGIDALGDVVLVHDSHDDTDHASRLLLTGASSACALLMSLAFVLLALRNAREPANFRDSKANGNTLALLPFVGLVCVLGLAFVAGMELLDLRLGGQAAASFADVLGGSLPLGFALTLVASLGVAWTARRVARGLAEVQRSAIRRIVAWFLSRLRRRSGAAGMPRMRVAPQAIRPVLTRSSSKRGPPLIPVTHG